MGRLLRSAVRGPLGALVLVLAWERAWAAPVDLELVLAVDVSFSVNAEEFRIQTQGLAMAFRDPRVAAAIRAVGDQGIAVTVMQWSDGRKQDATIPWTRVRDRAEAEALAGRIAAMPRYLPGGGTAIGGALAFALRLFENNGLEGRRRVIDLSGDGPDNQNGRPSQLRDLAVAAGVTINGLAILNEDRQVGRYYSANVIGGSGAFVVTANDYAAYPEAILDKLIREIASAPVAGAPAAPRPSGGLGPSEHPGAVGLASVRTRE